MDFARFFFGQAHQFVVEVDGFERLDEKGVPAAAGAVNHAIDAALAAGDYGHHEAVVADSDEILLQRAVRMMRAQKSFERLLDRSAAAFRSRGAGARERRWRGRPACRREESCR